LAAHGGDLVAVRRSVGRALMLCGATAVAGFGFARILSNLGMASPRQSVRRGHSGTNMLISVFSAPPAVVVVFVRNQKFTVVTSAGWTGDWKIHASRITLSASLPHFYRRAWWRLGLAPCRKF